MKETTPYQVLAPIGVTAESSMAEVTKSLAGRPRGRGKEVQKAWLDLTKVKERLYVDFFLYRMDLPAEEQHETGADKTE